MSIRSPDINADYLQIRNIEMVSGDTWGLNVRLKINNTPNILTESGKVTFAIFSTRKEPALAVDYDSQAQTQDGYVYIYLTPAQTAQLKANGKYTYELEWYINANTIYTLLKGDVKIVVDKITDSVRGD